MNIQNRKNESHRLFLIDTLRFFSSLLTSGKIKPMKSFHYTIAMASMLLASATWAFSADSDSLSIREFESTMAKILPDQSATLEVKGVIGFSMKTFEGGDVTVTKAGTYESPDNFAAPKGAIVKLPNGSMHVCDTEMEFEGPATVAVPVGTQLGFKHTQTIWLPGAVHRITGVLVGLRGVEGLTFESNPEKPLEFRLEKTGYVYVGGAGKVTLPSGATIVLPLKVSSKK